MKQYSGTMKKVDSRYWLLIILLCIAISAAILRVLWELHPERTVNLLVIDKTVLNDGVQEHKPLFWVLRNEKLLKKNRAKYNPKVDYKGFFPDGKGSYNISDLDSYSKERLASYASELDAVYYADMYGIYTGEWTEFYEKSMSKDSINLYLERTSLIYGGMSYNDLLLLKEMKRLNKLVIIEFNAIASPTASGVRQDFENTFGVKWQGWIGRFYHTLDTNKNKELPISLKKRYLEQNNGVWPFRKSGIAFINRNDKVVILEHGTHLSSSTPKIATKSIYKDRYELPSSIKYSYWFDIVETSSKNDVIASYIIDVNEKGQHVLDSNHIPSSFPAVIKNRGNDARFYYLAGDFSDIPLSLSCTKFYRINKPLGLLRRGNLEQRKGFMWRFYTPLIRNIFNYGLKDPE